MPAGMTLPVRKNLGTNCAASNNEMINAVANPATLQTARRRALRNGALKRARVLQGLNSNRLPLDWSAQRELLCS
jgi:hypothetical protein